jgi:serine/threonine protein kinase
LEFPFFCYLSPSFFAFFLSMPSKSPRFAAEQLSSLVNRAMFPNGITIHSAHVLSAMPVIDTASNQLTTMKVLVVTVPSRTEQGQLVERQVHLGMPREGLNTLFGGIVMGMALFTHPSFPGHALYNSQKDFYEVAIKCSSVDSILARVHAGGQENQENPVNELALMAWMQQCASQSSGFAQVFPHNMSLDLAATDGESLFTILPRMKNSMDMFAYCFEHVSTKQARLNLPFQARMQEVKMIFRAIARGIAGLHAQHIAHRDVSLENILISVTTVSGNLHIDDIKVIDYGMAVCHSPANASLPSVDSSVKTAVSPDAELFFDFDDEDTESLDSTTVESTSQASSPQRCGGVAFPTPFYGKISYAPPECFFQRQSTECDPRKADMWALGIVLFALAFNELLFTQAHPKLDTKGRFELLTEDLLLSNEERQNQSGNSGIRRLLYQIVPKAVTVSEPLLIDLLEQLLQVHPNQRLSAEEILHHPWLEM